MSDKPFEPEITAFMCIYCGYMAADTASALRIEYPANVKLIKMPCSGKTDSRYILKAFEDGADGVYIVACPKGNCHHVRGNERGELRVEHTKKILDDIGLDETRRIPLEHVLELPTRVQALSSYHWHVDRTCCSASDGIGESL